MDGTKFGRKNGDLTKRMIAQRPKTSPQRPDSQRHQCASMNCKADMEVDNPGPLCRSCFNRVKRNVQDRLITMGVLQ